MKINPEIMKACVKHFKLVGNITSHIIIRHHKLSMEMAVEICNQIAKRFPNLWRDRDENYKKKYVENMRS